MVNRTQILMQLLKGLPKADKKKFLKTLHGSPEGKNFPDPKMRQRVTTGGEYEPMSGSDMARLMSQQDAAEGSAGTFKLMELAKLLKKEYGFGGGSSDKELEALLLSLVTPRRSQSRISLPVLNRRLSAGRENVEVPF
jgi:hypothetical protein